MATTEAPETLAKPEETEVTNQEMEIVTQGDDAEAVNGGAVKRGREEADGDDVDNDDTKKSKLDTSVEEQRLEKTGEEGDEKQSDLVPEQGKVSVGPKSFASSVEMFDYFYKFLHAWVPNLDVNKYEHITLLELIKKGHTEPDKKIGPGVRAFQIRYHPRFKSRCFFIIREDDSEDDFSFRKCVNQICPLPENMQIKDDVNKALGRGRGGGGGGGGGGGRGRGRGHGRGRGGRPRN